MLWNWERRPDIYMQYSFCRFDLTLVNENYGYQIYFNGRHFASFAHRVSPTDITVLKIAGDLELYSVMLNDA